MRKFLYNLATDRYNGFIAGLFKGLLLLLSLIYGLIVRALIALNQLNPYRLKCKVISVGNITVGGTGKTSLVEFIARYLRQQGHKVAILTRGYRRVKSKEIKGKSLIGKSPESMGDEPYMLKTSLKDVPVLVDADRIRSAGQAIEDYSADTVILDDGFQQWNIAKDLEVVTIDATDPFGNQQMIPRGLLREPLSSLKRADVFILTKTNLNPDAEEIKDFLKEINPRALLFESRHLPLGFHKLGESDKLTDKDSLKGRSAALVCGIADPDSFENLIAALGVNVALSFVFGDHHYYSEKELQEIFRKSQEKNIDTIITTEKDAVRLHSIPDMKCPIQILVLRIALEITHNEQGFYNRLLKLYTA